MVILTTILEGSAARRAREVSNCFVRNDSVSTLGSESTVDSDEEFQCLPTTWKQHLYRFLEDSDSSVAALIFSHFILYTIVLSILCFVLETVPDLRVPTLWAVMEMFSTIVFLLEYLARFAVCDAFGQSRFEFLRHPMNFLDLAAILPLFLEELIKSVKPLRVLRSVRLVRCFRIFRLSKYSAGMNMMIEAVTNSVRPLLILSFFLMIGVVLSSSLLYYAEKSGCPTVSHMNAEDWQVYQNQCSLSTTGRDANGELCCNRRGSALDFESIPMTFWWSVVTMTTVGYGDRVPRTVPGRIVAMLTMLSGILLISLPVAIVGSKFQHAYEEYLDQRECERMASGSSSFSLGGTLRDESNPQGSLNLSANLAQDQPPQSPVPSSPSPPAPSRSDDFKKMGERPSRLHQVNCGMGHIESLRAKLRVLERTARLSERAREQVLLVLELFEHIERVEKQLTDLKQRDTVRDECIRKSFVSLLQS
uniref:Ion transport domain-containing protein n=1 Tax=Noctiluca scintillans TaxID=2966 RepID=A0A7S1EY59_NOCSC|mmetsp:Transcript_17643/g.47685  ORF Transcript_17643/g.47685 Transcript_17643/m.47685 type:complete len:477 (+) Transcript_17643:58-1488(+)